MQYHNRFQQRYRVRRFELTGKFSFIHVGGGKFIYTIPSKKRPIVGRIDLSELPVRKTTVLIFIFVGSLFLFAFFSRSGIATTNEQERNNLKERNINVAIKPKESDEEVFDFAKMDPQEIERRSEEMKLKLLKEDEAIEKTLQDKQVKFISYKVKEGDTLESIARKYRIPEKFIIAENNIKPYTKLKVGQTIRIPNKPGIFYKVKRGDRLVQIAEKYQISIEDILQDNPEIKDTALLSMGKKIFLPNAVIPEPPPVWVPPARGRITSHFGRRIHPVYGFWHFHTGVDISMNYEPVKAARDGVVLYAGYMGGYGKTIILKHGTEFKTLYGHLSAYRVKTGQYVKAGQVIGISGNTGISTGPHLHFEVIHKGVPVNPVKFLKF